MSNEHRVSTTIRITPPFSVCYVNYFGEISIVFGAGYYYILLCNRYCLKVIFNPYSTD